jgi:hypothetical protein
MSQLNFLPWRERLATQGRRKTMCFVVATALGFALVLAAGYVYCQKHFHNLGVQDKRLSLRLKVLQRQLGKPAQIRMVSAKTVPWKLFGIFTGGAHAVAWVIGSKHQNPRAVHVGSVLGGYWHITTIAHGSLTLTHALGARKQTVELHLQ